MSQKPSILTKIRVAPLTGTDRARCCTPLRPNDGLISRVARAEATRSSAGDPAAFTGSVAHQLSATAATTPQTTPRGTAAAAPSSSRSRDVLEEGLLPLLSAGEDPFAAREAAVVREINRARCQPAQFAATLLDSATLASPFVPTGRKNFAELTAFAAELSEDVREATTVLAMLDEAEKREIASRREQWAVEDAERLKKSKKAPAPKKGRAEAGAAMEGGDAELEASRAAAISDITTNNAAQRGELQARIARVQKLLDGANEGLAILTACHKKLQGMRPAPALESSRGLSLAARAACVCEQDADPAALAEEFGVVTGPINLAMHSGAVPVSQVVFELLLCLQDPRRKTRAVLLDRNARLIGVGWRRAAAGPRTCCVVAAAFEELEAVATRAHLPLQAVRRMLPLAKELTSKSVLQVHGPHNIHFVEPTAHPVTCGNSASITLSCPPRIQIAATLVPALVPEPTAPVAVAGDVLVHRGCGSDGAELVEVCVAVPHGGRHKVVLFARDDEVVDSGFERISTVQLNAAQWSAERRHGGFPAVSSDFHARCCSLLSPHCGVLDADTEYTFRIRIPLTAYLAHEHARITRNLEAAASHANGSKEAAAALQASCAEAIRLREEAAERVAQGAPPLRAEIVALAKELTKKRGKDLERGKAQVAELEEQLRALDDAAAAAELAVTQAEERVVQHRRATRQASAQRRRYTQEREQVEAASDRSRPLQVQLSIEERRAPLLPEDAAGTVYSCTVRTPRDGGVVSLFIAGLVAVTWEVWRR